MPCMGPGRSSARAERLYEAVLSTLLKEGILTMPENMLPLPLLNARVVCLKELKKCLEEIEFQDACESF